MTTSTFLLLLLSLIIAGGLSFFQYYYKAKSNSNVKMLLAFLRFLSLLALFILLINPILTRKTLEIVKPYLPIVVDNSKSISTLNAQKQTNELLQKIQLNPALQEKFQLAVYQFGSDFKVSEKLDFKDNQTNFDLVAQGLKSIYKNVNYPTVIITDGNQTSGNDYVYQFGSNTKVYPVVVGDTTKYFDLKINQLNANKYAFYKNKFPVEIFLQSSDNKPVQADFIIKDGNTTLMKEKVFFNANQKTVALNLLLPADKIGLKVYKASVISSEKEKNTYNNSKNFAVEILDQKTNIALISDINHPDIGSLIRAIENNAQRKVKVCKPNEIKSLTDFNVLIYYQPTIAFKSVFALNEKVGLSTFTITGINTDFLFLNQQQPDLTFKLSNQKEDYLAEFNPMFNAFLMDNIGFENFPPLENPFGSVVINREASILLFSKIRNVNTQAPLLVFSENKNKRSAYLLGENSWKWRLQSFVNDHSFQKYDIFVDKIIQYLSSSGAKKSLLVNHERFYNSGDAIEINAQYFNKNYEFDEKAKLTITVKNKATQKTKNYDLIKSNQSFTVHLDGLSTGHYSFTVRELNSNSVYSSQFEILEFDIEKQFVNANQEKLNQLAQETGGRCYNTSQVDLLVQNLIENREYRAIEKPITQKRPLIDWYWLLVIIILSLAIEWFVRKYNGLL